MGKLTIYLDKETESKLKQAAKSENTSVSKWVVQAVREQLASEWPDSVRALAGSWGDCAELLEDLL